MVKTAIVTPICALPSKNTGSAYKSGPIYFNYIVGMVFWLKKCGDFIKQGEAVCEVEANKKTAEFYAPATGFLCELCVEDGAECSAGDILGYIEVS
ncbi:MAG: lipoyl domain-containing protein [Clostridiales bacterium]